MAFTGLNHDPADDDLRWVELAKAELPGLKHRTVDLPLPFSRLLDNDCLIDEPTDALVDHVCQDACVSAAGTLGSRVHLTGMGGDQLLWGSAVAYRDLLRRRPLFALTRLRGYRAMFGWSIGATRRSLLSNRSHSRWLADSAAQLTAPLAAPDAPQLDWDHPVRMPACATPDAVETVRRLMRQAAVEHPPLAATRFGHRELTALWEGTRTSRICATLALRHGVTLVSPFFDDRVVEACFSVRVEDRITPWEYKPLLKIAMRGIVPDHLLGRTTKGEGSTDYLRGWAAHRADILALFEGSYLVRAGIIDLVKLRNDLLYSDRAVNAGALDSAIGCEIWLRNWLAVGATATR